MVFKLILKSPRKIKLQNFAIFNFHDVEESIKKSEEAPGSYKKE